MDSTSHKAPGKILWIGGYSVLERPNISMVSAVNAYVSARVKTLDGKSAEIHSPQLGMHASGFFDAEGRLSVECSKELLLLKAAVEVASRYAAANGAKISGISVEARNDSAFSYSIASGKVVKSGLGSSAAVTAASIGAILKFYGLSIEENDALHKLAQIAHSIATGKIGSGFDIAAAVHGSILYTRYSPGIVKDLPGNYSNGQLAETVKKSWDYKIEKFGIPENFRLLAANFIGESMSTSKSVGSVSGFKAENPTKYADAVKAINDENIKAVEALKKVKIGDISAMNEFRDAFDKGRLLTKELGVLSGVGIEPDDCTLLIEESKRHGAYVAKLPGAGGKDFIAALCSSDDNLSELRAFWQARSDLSILDIAFA